MSLVSAYSDEIHDLQRLGRVAIIGGVVRDTVLEREPADLDVVIYGSDREHYIEQIHDWNGVPNRFGGFAIHHWSTKVDVWHIADTWAHTSGHVRVRCLRDLLDTVFFDWDQIVYVVDTGHVICAPGYAERLRSGIMDIVLEPNPNPVGCLIRALRRASQWGVRYGPRLEAFVSDVMDQTPWPEIVALDRAAYPNEPPLIRP
jgi:hypothetical protein